MLSLFIALPCLAEAGQYLELKACHLERSQQLILHLQAQKQVVGAGGRSRADEGCHCCGVVTLVV